MVKKMVAQEIARTVELGENHTWEVVSDHVSFIRQGFKRPGKGGRTSKIKCVYVGCESYKQAIYLRSMLFSRLNRARVTIRESQRSIGWEYEVKVQGDFNLSQIFSISLDTEALCHPSAAAVLSPAPSNLRILPSSGLNRVASDRLQKQSTQSWGQHRKKHLFC